ncbi:MAG: murein biosynthesis integral membrane protein MurJ [Candidatus Caenarcaniphilales bacterium]|nr:murein biosynthesis integral membrane protein MurJ [Candidatus Caenarcaniphilales bacterium]
MLRVASLIAGLTLISKLLGLVRDLVIAHYFGTSTYSDAFNLAYLFTGNIFIIFACVGGPIYSTVVASLPKVERSLQGNFLKKILVSTSLIFIVVTALIFFTKDFILKAFIDQSLKPEYFDLTLRNIDVLLPLILITAPNAILAAVLNIYKKYFASSLSPAITNIALIISVIIFNTGFGGLSLALGSSIGGIFATTLFLPSFLKIVNRKSLNDDSSSENFNLEKLKAEIKSYDHILIPALMSTGFAQLMVFVDSFFCKGLEEGAWTAVTLANRLIQMPMGILITSIVVPLFPKISLLVKQANFKEINSRLLKLGRNLLALCIPGVIIGVIWHADLIRLVFERGAFDARSTAMVSSLFFYLCLGIIPYLFKELLVRTFYSFGDSRTPFMTMGLAIVIKASLNYFLVPIYGLDALAMTMVCMNIVSFLILLSLFIRKSLKKKTF